MTREEWLQAAVDELRPWIEERTGRELPKVSVTVGWPSHGGTARKKQVIGQCWDGACSEDGSHAIFISPVLGAGGKDGALATLAHEMVHALVGIDAKHKGPFAKAARKIGLVGKPTNTVAGDELLGEIERIMAKLGEFPHAKLTPKTKEKKQTARMIKCECELCGYVCRTTRKWLDDKGAPFCPCSIEGGDPVPMKVEDYDPSEEAPEEPEPEDVVRPSLTTDESPDTVKITTTVPPQEYAAPVPRDTVPDPGPPYEPDAPSDEEIEEEESHEAAKVEDDDGPIPPCWVCGAAGTVTRGKRWFCGDCLT